MLTIFNPDALQVVALVVGDQLLDERLNRLTRHGRDHSDACCSWEMLKPTDWPVQFRRPGSFQAQRFFGLLPCMTSSATDPLSVPAPNILTWLAGLTLSGQAAALTCPGHLAWSWPSMLSPSLVYQYFIALGMQPMLPSELLFVFDSHCLVVVMVIINHTSWVLVRMYFC